MANYTIDILAQIKGNEKVTRFNNTLKATNLEVKQLNKFLKEFQQGGNGLVKSFDTLNNILTSAKANFNAVASGTKLQEKAARELVLAEKQLNKEYKQREKLLNSLRTSYTPMPLPGSGVGSDPVAKSIRRRRRKLAGNSQAYSSPVGPFQASQLEMIPGFGMGSLQGQSSPVGDKIARALANEKRLVKEVEAIRGKASKKRAANTKRQLALEKRSNAFVKKAIKEEAALRRKAEKEANALAAKRRARRQKIGSTASSAIIGGAFPLLFGQTGAAAVGGGLGGLAGGAIGGQFGFALSILGTAIGSAIDKNDKFNQSLAALNVQFSSAGNGAQLMAKDIDSVASRLKITKDEAISLLGSFSQFGSSTMAKSLTEIFGTDSGAFNTLAGTSRQAEVANQIFEARSKIGNEVATQLLNQNLITDSATIELALAEARAKAENDIAVAQAKQISWLDRFRDFGEELLYRGGGDASRYGKGRANKLQKEFEEGRTQRMKDFKEALEQVREMLGLVSEAQGKFGQSGNLAFSSINDRVKDLEDGLAKLYNPIYRILTLSQTMESSFKDSFKGIITGTMSVQDAFRNMFLRIADSYAEMVADMLAKQATIGLLKFIGRAFLGGLASEEGIASSRGANRGGTDRYGRDFDDPNFGMPNRATGGPVSGGKPYIVGEEGPEIFTPGVSGGITPNHALGGSTNISVNIDASGTSVQGSESNGEELGRLVAAAIQSELLKEKRPGGLLS